MKALVLIFVITALLSLCFFDLSDEDETSVFPAIASAFFAMIAAIDFMFILAYVILRSMS